MEIFRRYFVVILLTAIIVIVWGGILLLSDKKNSTINPNAQTYTKPLSPTFDGDVIKAVDERTEKSFPIPPTSFFELDSQD